VRVLFLTLMPGDFKLEGALEDVARFNLNKSKIYIMYTIKKYKYLNQADSSYPNHTGFSFGY